MCLEMVNMEHTDLSMYVVFIRQNLSEEELSSMLLLFLRAELYSFVI